MARRGVCMLAAAMIGLCALRASAETPESVIFRWPDRSRTAAWALIEKYGEPIRFDRDSLVWNWNGPWRRTVVYRAAPGGFLRRKEIVEQSIIYDVPGGSVDELRRFDGRIRYDPATGEMSVLGENENLNFLALNIANEIVAGKLTVEGARDYYRRTSTLAESGKRSAYYDGFIFPVGEASPFMRNPAEEPLGEPHRSATLDPLDPANGTPSGPGNFIKPPDGL
ncbi:MAG: hypothetical protein ACHQ49_04185 [Elusimicrobiota bacterium]